MHLSTLVASVLRYLEGAFGRHLHLGTALSVDQLGLLPDRVLEFHRAFVSPRCHYFLPERRGVLPLNPE